MLGRKKFYSLLVILLTAASVTMMARFEKIRYDDELNYFSPYYAYQNEDDSKYIGYIFDDYNINVNLAYKDKSSEEPADDGAISISSESVLDAGNTADSMRMLRSEKIIDKRAQMEDRYDSANLDTID